MTFYDSFARLGRDLERSQSASMAWVWRHYNGLHYQSFAERVAAAQPFVPMAWVWSSYQANLSDGKIDEIASDDETLYEVDVAPYEAGVAPLIYHEAASKINNHLSEASHIISGQNNQIDKLQTNAENCEDNETTSGDIIKLIASLVFAASIIYGVHVLRG